MLAIFLKTLPFFALIGLGYVAGRRGFFTTEATAYLTKFVFYFALSAMLFNFAANLTLAEVFDLRFITAYLWGCGTVYLIATAVGIFRGLPVAESAVEAQCAVIGNVGFLGIPMFVLPVDSTKSGSSPLLPSCSASGWSNEASTTRVNSSPSALKSPTDSRTVKPKSNAAMSASAWSRPSALPTTWKWML